jgi:hypothetical protein
MSEVFISARACAEEATAADTTTSLSTVGLRPDQVTRLRSIRDDMYGWKFMGFAVAEDDGTGPFYRVDLGEEPGYMEDAMRWSTIAEAEAEIARMLEIDQAEWELERDHKAKRGVTVETFKHVNRYVVALYQRGGPDVDEWESGDASCAPVK